MKHKLIVVYDAEIYGGWDEDAARWYGQFLRSTDEHIADVYVVVADTETGDE